MRPTLELLDHRSPATVTSMDSIGVVASAVGAFATVILGVIAYKLSQQAQRYSAQRSIGDLQTAMANLRASYPEVLALSVKWGAEETGILYGRIASPDRDAVVRYYSYLDLGLEFCNTALSAASKAWIAPDVFAGHYRPLVRHFLAENYPFVEFALQGPYLSRYVRDELAAAETEGWDWHEKHQLLGLPPAL